MKVAFSERPDEDAVVITGDSVDELVIRAAQHLLPITEPVTLIGIGRFGSAMPRLAFARRAARRAVEGYVLVDCDLPVVSGDWPDAPVTYIARSDEFATHAKVASDRGWSVGSSL